MIINQTLNQNYDDLLSISLRYVTELKQNISDKGYPKCCLWVSTIFSEAKVGGQWINVIPVDELIWHIPMMDTPIIEPSAAGSDGRHVDLVRPEISSLQGVCL